MPDCFRALGAKGTRAAKKYDLPKPDLPPLVNRGVALQNLTCMSTPSELMHIEMVFSLLGFTAVDTSSQEPPEARSAVARD